MHEREGMLHAMRAGDKRWERSVGSGRGVGGGRSGSGREAERQRGNGPIRPR